MPMAYVSYAREDLAFVQTIRDALSRSGRALVWDRDQTTILPNRAWRDGIMADIRRSAKFVFVISPDSLESVICANELGYAVSLNKHVIPVLRRSVAPGQKVRPPLEELNWIFFANDDAFDARLGELIRILGTDPDTSAEHARLLVSAADWKGPMHSRSQLLRGRRLRASERFLVRAPDHGPLSLTQEQREYVAASRRWRQVRRIFLAVCLAVMVGLSTFEFFELRR